MIRIPRIPRIAAIAAAVALLAAGAAGAQNAAPAAEPAAGPETARTIAEMQQHVRDSTAAIDADRDGFITAQEEVAWREAKRGDWTQRRLERLDADGDGKVSTAEYETGKLDRIAKLDADGDGSISREEMRGARKHGRFGHGGSDGPGFDGEH